MDTSSIFQASFDNLNNREQITPKINTEDELDSILSTLPSKETSFATMAYDLEKSGEDGILGKTEDLKKYRKYGITPNDWENLDKQLADAQSNWAKLGNGLAQAVVSEIGLGTVGAAADIFDYIAQSILHLTDEDYSNPISNTIKEWQDVFNNEIAPVYTDPDVNIQNGGLTDFGWYCKNIPNIASTLMLLLPAKGATLAASALIKGSKLAKGIGNARRWATGINKLEDATQMSKFQASLNSFEGVARANKAFEISGEALLMRTAENYQEARETHSSIYKKVTDAFDKMNDETFAEWIKTNKAIFGNEQVNTKDKDEVAKYIARKSADRTFAMDFSNIIFDIIQLHGLKNMGKGMQQLKRTRKIRGLQEESIAQAGTIEPLAAETTEAAVARTTTAGATAEVTQSFLDKVGAFGKRIGQGVYDSTKFNAKTILEESTEGIEEAVNYIAQQEGITYGKMLLKGQTDPYDKTYWTAIPSTWAYMNGNLSDYLSSPELQESAFWGVAGGVAFHHIGSAFNKGQLAIEHYKENKDTKENPITGEKVERSSISQLFEQSDVKTARMTMEKRSQEWNTLRERLKTINSGRDPYSTIDEHNQYTAFTGDIESKKAIARARAITDFRSNLAIDAVNSGTYDMLVEYLKSKEVKQAMVKLGLTTENEVESYTEETIRDLESAKDEYTKHSAHILNQIAFMNNTKGRYANVDENIDNEDIPVEYARIIAYKNYLRARAVKAIEQQIAALGVIEADQANITANFNPNVDIAQAKDAVALGALLSAYQRLSVQEKEVEAWKPNDSLGRINKGEQLEQIKAQKEAILKGIKRQSFNNENTQIANVFNAFAIGRRSAINPNTRQIEESIQATDEDIIKDVRAFFGEEIGDVSDESIIQSAKALNKKLNTLLNENDNNSIVNANKQLFRLFEHTAQLELQKVMEQSLITSSISQIREQINYYYNGQNEVRKKKITFAEGIITRAIREYKGVKDENGNDLIISISEAHKNNVQEARRIAESVMATPGEGAVTASEFIDALNILALHRKSNKVLYDIIKGIINQESEVEEELELNQGEENATSQNGTQASQNTNTNNPTSQIQQTNRQQPVTSQEQIGNQTDQRQRKNLKVIINNNGNINSISVANTQGRNTFPVRVNRDGTYEFDTEAMTMAQKLDLVAAGLYEIADDVDFQALDIKWIATSNPIVKLNNKRPFTIVKKGFIENKTEEQQIETPEQKPEQETEIEEGTNLENNENIDEENNVDSDTSSDVDDNSIASSSSSESMPPLLPIGGTISPVGSNQTGSTVVNPSTGEGVDFDEDVINTTASKVGDLTKADIDFAKIESESINELVAKYPNKSKEDIETAVKIQVESLRKANQHIQSLKSSVLQTGAGAMYFCKLEDPSSDNFTFVFETSAEAFLNEYSKLLLVNEVDGKKLIRLDDIMRLCKNVYPSTNSNELGFFFNIIINYLNKHKDKYEVIDANKTDYILEDINKTKEQIADEQFPDGEFRVNIRDFIDMADTSMPSIRDAYFNILDSLKVGDKVQMVVEDNELIFIKDNVTIGNMPLPSILNGRYLQVNQSWYTDVTIDANGDPVSKTMDLFKDLFLGNTIAHDDLRQLLASISVATEAKDITDSDKRSFETNPLIATILNQARSLKNRGEVNTIVKIEDDGSINTKELLLHLVRLWNYTNIAAIATSRAEIFDNININLNTWFKKLYNTYDRVYNIDNNQEVTVTKKKGYTAIKLFDSTEGHYDELPLAMDALADPDNTRLTCVNFDSSRSVRISNRTPVTIPGQKPGSTYVSLFNGDELPSLIKVYGLRLSDIDNVKNNQELQRIGAYVKQYLTEVIREMIDAGSMSNTVKLQEAINAIITTNNPNGSISLFRPYGGKSGTFSIEPIRIPNDPRASGITISFKLANGKITRFRFFNKTSYNTFGYTTSEGKTLSNNQTRDATIAQDAAESFILWLKDKVAINIDFNAIDDDSINDTNHKGFINKKNGKLVINIPTKVNNGYTKEFDSYHDFIVKNNLIKVNTKKGKNGKNFERFGEKQTLNQILCVSLPTKRAASPTSTTNLPKNVKLEEFTEEKDYNGLVDSFNKTTINGKEKVSTSGEHLFLSILPRESAIKLSNIALEEDLEIADLFPETVEYVSELNDYNVGNINNQPIAATTGGNEKVTTHIYRNGQRVSYTLTGKNRVIVGPKFINMASSKRIGRKLNAVKILMHERIHNILQSTDSKNIELLKNLIEVFEEFKQLAIQDISNSNLSAEDKAILEKLVQLYNKYEAKHKERVSKGQEPNYKHIEEFLVDSLTNGFLYDYLNSKIVENAKDNKKPENLLSKILKALAKFFGWKEVADNSLLMKELNIVRNEFKNNDNVIHSSSNETQISNELETLENNSTDENKSKDKSEEKEDDEFSILDDYDILSEEDRAFLEEDNDDEANDAIIEDKNVIEDDYIHVDNVYSFKNSLPLELQAKFASLVNDGTIETKCY